MFNLFIGIMEKAIFNLVFNRKKKLRSNGTALIQVEAYLRPRKKYFSTSIYITPSQWDAKNKRIKNHENAPRLNKELRDFIAELEAVELDRRQSGKVFNLDILEDYKQGKLTYSFLDFIDEEIAQSRETLTTIKSYRTTVKGLREYRKVIMFGDVTLRFVQGFETFLHDKGLKINTVHKYLKIVRKFVRLAVARKLIDYTQNPFNEYKLKKEDVARVFLSPEELEVLEGLKFSNKDKHLEVIRDIYLFAVYTGVRYSDVMEVRPSWLSNEGGKVFLSFRMHKTKKNIRLPISLMFDGKGVALFNKYASSVTEGENKPIFGAFTNQYINRALKDIQAIAGFSKVLKFHSSRHTCATMLIHKGVPAEIVQPLLGHARIETTLQYTAVTDRVVDNALSGVEW